MALFFSIFDWPHCVLLGGATLGGVLVGIGILKESKEWTTGPILVLIGVIIEPLFTLGLFAYDETVSQGQRAEIIRLTTPRKLTHEAVGRIEAKVCPLGEPLYSFTSVTQDERLFFNRLTDVFATCKWKDGGYADWERDTLLDGLATLVGVRIWYGPENETIARALASALSDEGIIDARAELIPVGAKINPQRVAIQIGQRP